MTDPAWAVSTKCAESFGASLLEPSTICTVYAGPQMRVFAVSDGESMWISGMCPPCGEPSLSKASDISHVENPASLACMSLVVVDIARTLLSMESALLPNNGGRRGRTRRTETSMA